MIRLLPFQKLRLNSGAEIRCFFLGDRTAGLGLFTFSEKWAGPDALGRRMKNYNR